MFKHAPWVFSGIGTSFLIFAATQINAGEPTEVNTTVQGDQNNTTNTYNGDVYNGNIHNGDIHNNYREAEKKAVLVNYKVHMELDRHKTAAGRGWDYPIQQPDPYACVGPAAIGEGRAFCVNIEAASWQCLNQWECSAYLNAPAMDSLNIAVYDSDHGAPFPQGKDFVGEAICDLGARCRLTNGRNGFNSGYVTVTQVKN